MQAKTSKSSVPANPSIPASKNKGHAPAAPVPLDPASLKHVGGGFGAPTKQW